MGAWGSDWGWSPGASIGWVNGQKCCVAVAMGVESEFRHWWSKGQVEDLGEVTVGWFKRQILGGFHK